jgi:hypothetical protein
LDYVIRFRACITVTDARGELRAARDWVPKSARTLKLRDARVTNQGYQVGAVVLKKDHGMKDAWCLATSRSELGGAEVVALYSKRFTTEETFRDQKDQRFGMGLSQTRIQDPKRRDRALLVCAMASVLLTLLGAAGESLGEDRMLKANTSKQRTHSLLRQGTYYFAAMATWPEERSAAARPLRTPIIPPALLPPRLRHRLTHHSVARMRGSLSLAVARMGSPHWPSITEE